MTSSFPRAGTTYSYALRTNARERERERSRHSSVITRSATSIIIDATDRIRRRTSNFSKIQTPDGPETEKIDDDRPPIDHRPFANASHRSHTSINRIPPPRPILATESSRVRTSSSLEAARRHHLCIPSSSSVSRSSSSSSFVSMGDGGTRARSSVSSSPRATESSRRRRVTRDRRRHRCDSRIASNASNARMIDRSRRGGVVLNPKP